jgi:hypothetical protein
VDNEEDCGCVIRVGNPGRHRNNNDVRGDLHQDSENAGGGHMVDTAIKEGGECMNEIATVMNEEEFGYFLKSFEKKADLKSLSLISRRCQVVDMLCGLQSDTVLTVGQIKQLFDLAK